MQLVEQHVIDKNDKRFPIIDLAAFASKNLYNAANYTIRQEFIHTGRYITYPQLAKLLKNSEPYKALPAKVAQQVLINVDKNWQSFFAALGEWKEHPRNIGGKPSLPGYVEGEQSARTAKDKQKGRHILVYTTQAISRRAMMSGIIKPSGLDIFVNTRKGEPRLYSRCRYWFEQFGGCSFKQTRFRACSS